MAEIHQISFLKLGKTTTFILTVEKKSIQMLTRSIIKLSLKNFTIVEAASVLLARLLICIKLLIEGSFKKVLDRNTKQNSSVFFYHLFTIFLIFPFKVSIHHTSNGVAQTNPLFILVSKGLFQPLS